LNILVTGGAGFIGSAFIRFVLRNTEFNVLNVDALTYAGNLESLKDIESNPRYKFKRIDICDYKNLSSTFINFKPNLIVHFAAESHVDRSIDSPMNFLNTNIIGTFNLLEISRNYYHSLNDSQKPSFRFHHVSTDEVYGDLEPDQEAFSETNPYLPSSPYSASKASSDHFVRAWKRTYGLPVVITNCSNNYGPYQFPEKLIPLVINNAINFKEIPIYGSGLQIRDWLYVDDHVSGILKAALDGDIGETYNIGGNNELTNIDVVKKICNYLDKYKPSHNERIKNYHELISYVPDRVGHDSRYAINSSKIYNELSWRPVETFDTGLEKTIDWYLENKDWSDRIYQRNFNGERMGLLR